MAAKRFADFGLHEDVVKAVEMIGYSECTPVQSQGIPPVLEGRDLIACAQTGTGKTAAYVLPVVSQILKEPKPGVQTLVVAPTRELAIQIDQQFLGLGYYSNVSSLAIYGGNDSVGWDQQKKALTTGVDVVVATPGRLISHLNLGYVNLNELQILILDESDRMLDMGFHEDIIKIKTHLPKRIQTLMYSATMPPKIRQLANQLMIDPVEVNIAISKPADNVMQAAYLVYNEYKAKLVSHLLRGKDQERVILFSATKVGVREIAKALKGMKLLVGEIHSDLAQKDREETLRLFKARKFQVLVATDIVSRGIDIDGIDLIINYDVPKDAEDYVHRIGRTARAKRSGVAITFINDKDQNDFQKIEQLIERSVVKSFPPDGIGDGPLYKPRKQQYRKKSYKKKR